MVMSSFYLCICVTAGKGFVSILLHVHGVDVSASLKTESLESVILLLSDE
jgi:hypothetical protein